MSSPMGNAGPAQSFRSRVNRFETDETGGVEVSVLPDWRHDVWMKCGVPIAALLAVVSVLAVRIGLYRYTGTAMLGEDPNLIMATETGASLILAAFLLLFFPFSGFGYKLVQIAVVAVAITGMHNVVHSVPGLFSKMFSPEWTAQVLESTEPNSVLFQGETIVLKKEKKVVPTVLRLSK